MKLLVVEDQPTLRGLICDHLADRGFAVDRATGLDEAVAAISISSYDALVLDLGLSDGDGLDLLSKLSAGRVPTIIISARSNLEDRIDALNAGADDYLVKPFNLGELEARIRALLRRPPVQFGPLYVRGRLVFDPKQREARIDGVRIELTRREVALLEELMRVTSRFVTKESLEQRLYSLDEVSSFNALEATVSRLRKKLASMHSGVTVEVRRGIGYSLQEIRKADQ